MSSTAVETVPVTVEVAPALAAKLADPAVAESLTSLLTHADLVAILLEGADGLLRRTDEIGGSLAAGLTELKATDLTGLGGGIDVLALLAAAKTFASQAPELIGVLTPAMTEQVALVGRGLEAGAAAYASAPVPVTGLLSLTRLFKDPDILRAISYASTVAKAIGRELGK